MKYWKYLVSFLIFQKYGVDGVCEVADSSLAGYKIWCNSTDEKELFSFYEQSGYKYWREMKLENSRLEYLEKIIPNDPYLELFLSVINSNVTIINSNCLKDKVFNTLDLSNNFIQNLSFLDNLYVREILNLSHNRIQYIDGIYFERISAQYIDLSFNNIISVHEFRIEYNENLISLNLSHNSMRTLKNFFKTGTTFYSLQIIDLSFNNLEEISVSDFVHAPHLKCLNVSQNKLMSLDSSFQVNTLIAKNNIIRSFNFSSFSGKHLDVSDNRINEINISRNLEYLYLNVKNNEVEKLTTNKLAVAEINLAHNGISDISNLILNSDNFKPKRVSLNYNELKKVNLSIFDELKNISILNLSYNPLEYIFRNTSSNIIIDNLDLSHCSLKNLDQNIFRDLSVNYLDLSYNSLIKFPEDMLKNLCLVELDLGFNYITEFHISKNLCIKKLSLAGMISQTNGEYSNVSNTDTKQLDADHLLNISNNPASNPFPKSVLNYITLERLGLTENVSEFLTDFSQCNLYIRDLTITINDQIGKNSFEKLVSLQKLQIINSSISNLKKESFSGLTHLRGLYFNNSEIVNVEPGAFIGLDRLEYLDTFSLFRSVENLRSNLFEGLTNLKFLNLSGRGIQKVETNVFSGLQNLKVLDLSHNKLKTLKVGVFKEMVNLKEIYLQNNYFEEILPNGIFSNLNNLTHLDLSHCQIAYLNELLFFPLKKLNVLNLNYNFVGKFQGYSVGKNKIKIFNRECFPKLEYIGIGHNSWYCEFLLVMLKGFRLNQVDYLKLSDLEFETENIEGIQCM